MYLLIPSSEHLAMEYTHPKILKFNIKGGINDLQGYTPVSDLAPLRVTNEVYPVGEEEEVWDSEFTRDAFEQEKVAWEESETRKKFEVTLSKAKDHKINNIVGLACGSLSRPGRSKSAFQHVLLVTAKNWLQTNGLDELSCYMQDPEYTDVDRRIFRDVGFQVVDDPEGFLKVDGQSIVLSIAANVPTKLIIADIARPAIVIWFVVEEMDTLMLDPNSDRVREMMKGYDKREFKPDGTQFRDAAIYIRRTKDEPPFQGKA
ncbi:unnamed protein product [Penicillium egyptiacum]|uniref:SRR1-like domain-containing protein n=1 Tax=Penicillium egyptiacum TaxID=1303716 RepID=A0A9W4P8K1_9EURO|nr:unnamed protein product [Penicillium egyptiacum]